VAEAVGQCVWVEGDDQIDAVTAISGSGPAYVFYFVEAMERAAIEMGLSAEQGRKLAVETFRGAAALAAESSEPVSTLRERVTSKGGTTYAALTSMDASGIQDAFVRAMLAAAARVARWARSSGRTRKLFQASRKTGAWRFYFSRYATNVPANTQAPSQLLCRKAAKHFMRSRSRISV
jgi:hypothetical protein